MPTFDSLFKLRRDNRKVDPSGLLHVIATVPHVLDDGTVLHDSWCLGQDWKSYAHPTEQAAKEAGNTHLSEVQPAPSDPTVSSVIRSAQRK